MRCLVDASAFVLFIGCAAPWAWSVETKVAFDIPGKVECRDVTPAKCAAAHPTMKVIEAKFRISATFLEGEEASTADFVYTIASPNMRLKVLDFLPNTTLESSTADDLIEVTDSTESNDTATGEARVGYSILSLTGSKNLSTKRTESNRYQKVAPKNLVLASGTVNRGNGVFYKLRPSQECSLEGAKEFAVLCIVPRTWRGDWCTVMCLGRANKKTAFSSSIAISGIEHAHVGLYLSGDEQGSDLADALTQVQSANGGMLSKYMNKQAWHSIEDLHSSPTIQLVSQPSTDWQTKIFKIPPTSRQTSLDEAKAKLVDLETHLSRLAGKNAVHHE